MDGPQSILVSGVVIGAIAITIGSHTPPVRGGRMRIGDGPRWRSRQRADRSDFMGP
jgi:hypothetical protein